jgi:DNA polymerase/3'-5' exonuclease PolX
MTLAQARELAESLVALLAPSCQRIEIAGSIRRLKPNPNDIELVAVPSYQAVPRILSLWDSEPTLGERWTRKPDHEELMTDAANLLDKLCDDLLRAGTLEKRPDTRGRHCWGTGIKRAVFYHGTDYAPVDLFQVVAPAEWGVIYAIRTGPGDFNRLLVTNRRWGGGCPLDQKVAGGRVWRMGGTPRAHEAWALMPATRFAKLAEREAIDASLIPTPTEEDFFGVLHVPCWPPEERTEQQLRKYLQQTTRR